MTPNKIYITYYKCQRTFQPFNTSNLSVEPPCPSMWYKQGRYHNQDRPALEANLHKLYSFLRLSSYSNVNDIYVNIQFSQDKSMTNWFISFSIMVVAMLNILIQFNEFNQENHIHIFHLETSESIVNLLQIKHNRS